VDAMFAELNEMAMAEQADNDNNEQENNNDYQDDILNVVDAELLLYKREQHLPLRKAANGSYCTVRLVSFLCWEYYGYQASLLDFLCYTLSLQSYNYSNVIVGGGKIEETSIGKS
jgi:hypothetical protein